MIGLIVGRFQPFHNGHLEMIREAAGKADSLVIAVGSSNKSGVMDNPFTYSERGRMIRAALGGDFDFMIIAVPDVDDDKKWAEYIRDNIEFDVAFTNAETEGRIFREAGFKVEGLDFYRRNECMSTLIREKMISGEGWRDSVPDAACKILREINAVERLRKIRDES